MRIAIKTRIAFNLVFYIVVYISREKRRTLRAAFNTAVLSNVAKRVSSLEMRVLTRLQTSSLREKIFSPALCFSQYTKILRKKRKCAAVEAEPESQPPCPLSPEQLDRIARNKRAALERLATAHTPPGFGESWRKELQAEFVKPYFKKLMDFVSEERKRCTVYPPADQVFTWTEMCSIRDVKVVILGQDPYHGPGQAHGLCFSVKRPVSPPPSLENMYKELASDIEGFQHPGHGDLTGWAKQGVLLLNAVLTVKAHQANSHKDKGWENFTDAVVQWLSSNLEGVVFMLWGSYAQKKGASINRKRHHVLQAVHPSPLSAHRGFFGCKHFSKANDLLEKQGKSPIDWKAL
ncbi:PREDICTED: uracil-DNA glycosylase isoform X1 [Cyprinodon variegatus]|uniref:uracil-DNA glycosylase isoform X1 n=1 Tax=Cyprinodon variegatus TaxID=28743 RepID=UPI000742A84F|nr:PREDICTED: uracil-DNA glycosylase isoform X1 [Cyprinodon variegatus]